MIAIWGNKEHLTCVFPLWFSHEGPKSLKNVPNPRKSLTPIGSCRDLHKTVSNRRKHKTTHTLDGLKQTELSSLARSVPRQCHSYSGTTCASSLRRPSQNPSLALHPHSPPKYSVASPGQPLLQKCAKEIATTLDHTIRRRT